MAARITLNLQAMPVTVSTAAIIGGLSLLLFFSLRRCLFPTRRTVLSKLPRVPSIPGIPVIGNLLQLKEKKPYKTFTKWAGEYGPVYSIQTGASTLVVLSSTEVAKEAMVTRFSSISTRKLPNALSTLSSNKCMVAMSDYNDFHKTAKRHLLASVLGSTAQKRHRHHRETMAENVTNRLLAHAEEFPDKAVNFREIFQSELFGVALKLAIGKDIESVYVEEEGGRMSREEIFKVLVLDMMEGAIEVDWRDFFPYLRWIPNKRVDTRLTTLALRKTQVMRSLITDQKDRIASLQKNPEEADCYLEYLVTNAKGQSEEQISMLVWEDIIETSDTILVVAEWALFQLSNHPDRQDRLYREIKRVFGSEKVTEDRLSEVPYLMAVFHETLRRHAPVSLPPLRFAHEDTQLGGYFIPAGTQIAINIYGCHMDENQWERPEEWRPERFLEAKYEAMDMYKTLAFGAGKRICAGSLLATQISCTVIGRLVQQFVWRLTDGEEENVDTLAFTGRKLHPLHAIIKPRHY